MENLKWIFEGIGTEIVSLVVGLIIGGVSGYKMAIKKNGEQKQIAKDCAQQRQEIDIEETDDLKEGEKKNVNFRQTQKAGHQAEQSQIGRIKR